MRAVAVLAVLIIAAAFAVHRGVSVRSDGAASSDVQNAADLVRRRAAELSGHPDVSAFRDYLTAAAKYYNHMQTPVCGVTERHIIGDDSVYEGARVRHDERMYSNPTAKALLEIHPTLLLHAPGGYGKSLFMRYLFLTTASLFLKHRMEWVPVLIEPEHIREWLMSRRDRTRNPVNGTVNPAQEQTRNPITDASGDAEQAGDFTDSVSGRGENPTAKVPDEPKNPGANASGNTLNPGINAAGNTSIPGTNAAGDTLNPADETSGGYGQAEDFTDTTSKGTMDSVDDSSDDVSDERPDREPDFEEDVSGEDSGEDMSGEDSGEISTFVDLLGFCVREFADDITDEQLSGLLKEGCCLFLLDGFDEIETAADRLRVAEMFYAFCETRPHRACIISARGGMFPDPAMFSDPALPYLPENTSGPSVPAHNIPHTGQNIPAHNVSHADGEKIPGTVDPDAETVETDAFTPVELRLMDREQAVSLAKKLGRSVHAGNRGRDFCRLLRDSLYDQYRAFGENPYLLSMMFRTFLVNGEIPDDVCGFYDAVFDAFAPDAVVHGRAVTEDYTFLCDALDSDDFRYITARFCFRTYFQEQSVFPESILLGRLGEILRESGFTQISPEECFADLRDGFHLFIRDGDRYRFAWRECQAYFAAWEADREMDGGRRRDWFRRLLTGRPWRRWEDFFDLSAQMDPERFAADVLEPGLRDLVRRVKNAPNPDIAFLKMVSALIPWRYDAAVDLVRRRQSMEPSGNAYDYNLASLFRKYFLRAAAPYERDFSNWQIVDPIFQKFPDLSTYAQADALLNGRERDAFYAAAIQSEQIHETHEAIRKWLDGRPHTQTGA